MPDAEHGGVLGREQGLAAAAARKAKAGEDCRKFQKCSSFHVRDSFPHVAAKGGKPAEERPQLPAPAGSRPKIPPIFGFLGGFLTGKAQNPQNLFSNCPSKTAILGGHFFLEYDTVQTEDFPCRVRDACCCVQSVSTSALRFYL